MKQIYLTVIALALVLQGILFMLAPASYTMGPGSTLSDAHLLPVLRSFGGFYLGFAAFLVMALKQKNLMDGAVISVVVVMGGFLIGRSVSLLIDGIPEPKIWVSAAIECIFTAWGWFILRRSIKKNS